MSTRPSLSSIGKQSSSNSGPSQRPSLSSIEIQSSSIALLNHPNSRRLPSYRLLSFALLAPTDKCFVLRNSDFALAAVSPSFFFVRLGRRSSPFFVRLSGSHGRQADSQGRVYFWEFVILLGQRVLDCSAVRAAQPESIIHRNMAAQPDHPSYHPSENSSHRGGSEPAAQPEPITHRYTVAQPDHPSYHPPEQSSSNSGLSRRPSL